MSVLSRTLTSSEFVVPIANAFVGNFSSARLVKTLFESRQWMTSFVVLLNFMATSL